MTVLMTDTFRKKHHFHPNHFDLLAATSSWSCFVNHNLTHHADTALINSMPIIEVEAEAIFHLRGLPSNLTTAGVTTYTHGQCDPFKVGRQVSSNDCHRRHRRHPRYLQLLEQLPHHRPSRERWRSSCSGRRSRCAS